MISLQNLTKSYPTKHGRKYILKEVSTTLPEKTNIAILGANGAGKSTLMRLIGGIEQPDSGKVVVDKKVSWPIAINAGMQGSMTGRENATFVCRIYCVDEESIKKKIDYIYDFSELEEYFDMPVKTYSTGMRSRLLFSISMAFEFDIYLMDEIMSVGDHKFRQKCIKAIEEKSRKSNMIIISHDMKMLSRQCQVGIYLHEGTADIYEEVDEAIEAYLKAC